MTNVIKRQPPRKPDPTPLAPAPPAGNGAQRADSLRARAEALEAEALRARAEALEAQAQQAHAEALAAEAKAKELHAQLARGSRDFTAAELPIVAEVVTAAPVAPTESADPKPDAKSEIYQAVDRVLREKPHTFRDLCSRFNLKEPDENKLKSILVRLQRDGAPVVNLGNGARAIWWIDEHNRIAEIAAGKNRTTTARK